MTAAKKKPAPKAAAVRVRLPGLQYSPSAARKARAVTSGSATTKKPATMTAKKTPAKKAAPAKKAPAKKAPAKKPVPAKKTPAKKPVPAKKAPAKKPVPAKKAPAKKPAPAKKVSVKNPAPAPAPKPQKSGPHLSKAELAELRAAMTEELAKFAARTGSLKEQSLTRPDEENPEEAGTDAITIVTELAKANSGERRMNQIVEALRAIQRGDYGICQNCGAKIPIERLKALPDAKYCVPCQEELDRDGAGRSPWAQPPATFE